MRFASVCSGIEAASVAWHPLGWETAWVSEIDPFASSVLAHRFPDVPNLGDMTKIPEAALERYGRIDLLVGGTPCQSFSVAGLRRGLDDPRGSLLFGFLRLLARARPRWVVFENVPGLLSSGSGGALGAFLWALGDLGYGWAYRVLDAQHFGLAQRRRRLFVVGCAGAQSGRAGAVLFEPACLRGDPAPRLEARHEVAGALGAGSTRSGGRVGRREAAAGQVVAFPDPAYALAAGQGGSKAGSGRDKQDTFAVFRKVHRANSPEDKETWEGAEAANTLNCFDVGERDSHAIVGTLSSGRGSRVHQDHTAIAFHTMQDPISGPTSPALTQGNKEGWGAIGVSDRYGVRRLTPLEWERLQGFPDGWTLVPYRGAPAKDSPRYKAIGNSMAVPVMAWIGRRIALVDAIPW